MNEGRKASGGKYRAERKKRSFERKSQERVVYLKEIKKKQLRIRGGEKKTVMLSADIANISINGKTKKAQIKNVLKTPQNFFLSRQNRLMRGAIIETSMGKAKITNRPSQEGHVNAVLVENY